MCDFKSWTVLQTLQNDYISWLYLHWNIPLRKKVLCFELYNSRVRKGTLWTWAPICVLLLCLRIRKLRVRMEIEGCGWGQGREAWALLMALGIQTIIYSSTQGPAFGNFKWIVRSCRHVEESSRRFARRKHTASCHVRALIKKWLKAYSVFEETTRRHSLVHLLKAKPKPTSVH